MESGKALDINDHYVNANGYLIDDQGNIVNSSKQVVFKLCDLI